MRKNILILLLVIVVVMILMILGSGGSVNGESGGGSVVGKVSNTFGSSLGRDIDGDGDNDSGVILSNIVGGGNDYGNSIAIDGSGRIYVTGSSRNVNGNDDAYVIRLNVDGSMDSSFGIRGKVILKDIAGNGYWDYGYSLSIDGNEKVYVTGQSGNDAYVIRLNKDGSMDSGFGSNLGRDINGDGNTNDYGVILNNIAGGGCDWRDYGYSIVIDRSGKVYVTGDSYNGSNSDAYVIRLNEDGSMDGSFGSGGKVILSSIAGGNGVDYGSSVAIDGNGKVYVTGFSSNGSNDDAFVIRLNSDGSVDSGFGSGGKVVLHNITGGNGRDICNSMVIDVNGKVYITGYSDNISSNADAYVIKIE